MLTHKRQVFFFLDYLLLALILGINVFFKRSLELTFLGLYLGIALFLYIFCLFLSAGFFIRIEHSSLRLRDNLLALIKGVAFANVTILTLVFFFYHPYRNILFYHTLLSGAAVLAILCLTRTIEWKYFWPRGPFRILILGEEPYLHLYLKDILFHWAGKDAEILVVLPNASARSKNRRRFTTVGGNTIRYITGDEAQDRLTSGPPFTAVALGREPLDQELLDLVPCCYQVGYSVVGIDNLYELVCQKVPLFQVGDSWLAHTSFQRPAPDLVLVKRAFDLLFSTILLLLFFPVGLLIALAIKLDSPGPVFYIQERNGLYGKPFRMFKFRSMQLGAESMTQWPYWRPEMVTRVGHILRKTGLDEVPQLINILKGEMSFVGPRPCRTWVTQRHIAKNPFFAISLAMRPGVTGWSQIHQGQDAGDETILERTRYNLYYAKKYSLLFDLEIILKTCRIALLGEKPARAQAKQISTITVSDRKAGGN